MDPTGAFPIAGGRSTSPDAAMSCRVVESPRSVPPPRCSAPRFVYWVVPVVSSQLRGSTYVEAEATG